MKYLWKTYEILIKFLMKYLFISDESIPLFLMKLFKQFLKWQWGTTSEEAQSFRLKLEFVKNESTLVGAFIIQKCIA